MEGVALLPFPTFLGYVAQVGNGSSATPSTVPFKKIRGNVYVVTMNQKLTIGLYGDYMTTQLSPYNTSNSTFKAYASFKTEAFRIGFEFFQQTNMNSDAFLVYDPTLKYAPLTSAAMTSGVQQGVSVFGSVSVIKNKLNVFARFDMYNPDTKWNINNVYSKAFGTTGTALAGSTFYTQNFMTAGLDWTPDKRFHIMPNIWYNSYNAMMSTSGPDFTGKPYSTRMVKDADIAYRLTFYYIFNGSKKVGNNGMY